MAGSNGSIFYECNKWTVTFSIQKIQKTLDNHNNSNNHNYVEDGYNNNSDKNNRNDDIDNVNNNNDRWRR